MGSHKNISINRWPKQGSLMHRDVKVCFHYRASEWLYGTCVRDDREAPFVTIFRLDDGRLVLATECQYQPVERAVEAVGDES